MITSLAPLSPLWDLFYTDRWLIMFRARVRFYIYTLENAAGTFLEHKLVVWCSHNPNVEWAKVRRWRVLLLDVFSCIDDGLNVFYKTVNWMNCLLRGGGQAIVKLRSRSGDGQVRISYKMDLGRVRIGQGWFQLKFKGHKKHLSWPTAQSSKLKSHS